MADEFKVGDRVQLKSGGPTMTVRFAGDEYGTKVVYCAWFDGNEEQKGKFPPGTLKIVEDTKRS